MVILAKLSILSNLPRDAWIRKGNDVVIVQTLLDIPAYFTDKPDEIFARIMLGASNRSSGLDSLLIILLSLLRQDWKESFNHVGNDVRNESVFPGQVSHCLVSPMK